MQEQDKHFKNKMKIAKYFKFRIEFTIKKGKKGKCYQKEVKVAMRYLIKKCEKNAIVSYMQFVTVV